MEELLAGFKLWGPFAVFFVATLVFGWRILNRREDKLEARVDKRQDQLEARVNEGFSILKDSIEQLREDIRQTNTRLDTSIQALGAEISKLAEKIEANSHDLRTELARLNQNHVNHLENHEEFRQRSEQK